MDRANSHTERIQAWSNAILHSKAETFCRQFPESLLVLPYMFQQPAGALGVHRLTLTQLARQLAEPALAALGLAPITHLGGEAVAARVAFRAREQGSIAYFREVAALPGFSRALARTLRELRLAGTTPETLAEGEAPARDLAALLADHERELEERALVDLAGIFELACDAAERGAHRWASLPVAMLDVPLESAAHRTFFETMLRRAPRAFVATLDKGEDDAKGEEDARGSLAQLRRNLFQSAASEPAEPDGQFEFFSAPGEGLEAVEIARRIVGLARARIAFDQVAILLRNPERYQPMIEDALRRAGIPAYFSHGAMRPDPSGRAFLALLACARENLSASRFAEYMSLGQIPQAPAPVEFVAPEEPLPEDEPAPEAAKPTPRRWEQYLVDAAVIGGRDRWERRLRGLEAEWELDAEANADRLQQLRNLRDFALPLIDALASLPRAAAWKDWLTALRQLAGRALRAPEGVAAILAEFEPMGDVGPATLEEVIEVLQERLRFLRREPSVRRWGQVFVAPVDEARGRDFSVVFLPGLAEGLFPQRINEDPLLLDEFRKALDERLPLRPHRVYEERRRLHLAVAAARDKLIASYPRMEVAEARPRVPSFYALELPRAIYGRVPELNEFERQAREAAPARLNWPAPKTRAEAIDDAEYDLTAIAGGSAQHVLQVNEHAARSLRARWTRWHPRWKPADGLVVANEAALLALAKERLSERHWSPSALETLAACPYKFALRGIFRLREREDSAPLEQLDPRTRGSLFHAVQSSLYEELRAGGMLPVTMDTLKDALARLETALRKIAAEYAEKLAPAIPRVWESEIDGLRTDLRGWLHFTAANESDWEPLSFELPFEVDLPGVKLHGRIDAVEGRGDARRVVDYKTGKAPETIPRWVGGGKHLQPLLYALAAEQKLGTTVEAGRLLYATQRGNYTPVEMKLDARARQVIERLLADIDTMIAGGFLPPVPEKDACRICDYRIVCGPYEAQRLTKKDRHEERMDPLIEIRGMA